MLFMEYTFCWTNYSRSNYSLGYMTFENAKNSVDDDSLIILIVINNPPPPLQSQVTSDA